ncbi:MAG: hypothetical protein LQ346_008841 [Caloplaca aetnensis]|nr:MAG: hypothetical protein LQ346_008841 [Caloplaca aetnensis]
MAPEKQAGWEDGEGERGERQRKALGVHVQAAVDKALAETTAEEWVRNVEKEVDYLDLSLPENDARREEGREHDADTLDGLSSNTNRLRIENEVSWEPQIENEVT